ncbi:fms-related tyrosine kinase 3 ligand isoform X2 [Bufo bufo]|uniref:fms-related tyrosine kinase 3 ligand isoform X2 n=1 Tax=Bufo bufo TaxID=8384 RepID=UPI001ABE4D1B|nr:fms-related tyrosine kinase 3 ligand isoform X2 [Bufo bufo]XP_040289001.1 fms-related tyrosine kinase 3 ligand isoform X2 [Bufo bufo]XP_040289006.1 fms-related tyrosine kinase 3 ligand isoform X2 [Bufo bufo]
MQRGKSLLSFSHPVSKFSYEEMINCHDSRGKGIVFLLLVICSGLSYSCSFNHNPISDDYMKKINTMEGYIPFNSHVKRPVIIPEEKEDQNCIHLLELFLINYTLANIGRRGGSELDKRIIGLQYEIYFIEECSFTIPSACPNESVTIPTILKNLNASLAALKPHIENNFSHCLRVKCAEEAEHISTMRNTIATRRHNKGHQDSNLDVISEEPTTPMVKLNDGLSDQISGDPLNQSKGTRNHFMMIGSFCSLGIILLLITIYFVWKR